MLSDNQKRVYQLVRQHGSISRADIVRQIDLTFPSVSRIVAELLELKVLQEGATRRGGMGKPPTYLSVNPGHAYSLGVHQEGDKARGALIDALGQKVASGNFSAAPLTKNVETLLARAKVESAQLLGIGLSRSDGETFEETILTAESIVRVEPMIAASVRAERYFGHARNLDRFLYFDAHHLELGSMVRSTVLARSGTLGALVGVADGIVLQNGNLIPAALRGAAALLQTRTVFVSGLSDEDLVHLQKGPEGLKVTQASEWVTNPALTAATLPLDEAYSLA